MIIKLDTAIFRPVRLKTERITKVPAPLTRLQWINADRIVIATMFIVAIAGAVLF